MLNFRPRTEAEFARAQLLLRAGSSTSAGPRTNGAAGRAAAAPAAVGYGTWSEWGAPERFGHVMVYDSRRHRMIVLGGGGVFDPQASVWSVTLPQADWTQLTTLPWGAVSVWSQSPITSAVYDSLRDRLLVLHVDGAFELDAFALGATEWTHVWTGPATSTGAIAGMAIDTRRDVLALLGVWDALAARHRVIRVPMGDPSGWTSELTSGVQPIVANAGCAVYDEARDAFQVLFQDNYHGRAGPVYLSSFDAAGPSAWGVDRWPEYWSYGGRTMALDRAGDRLVLSDANMGLIGMPLGGAPVQWLAAPLSSNRFESAGAFDPVSRRFYLHGGTTETWVGMERSPTPLLVSASVDSAGSYDPVMPAPENLASWLPMGDPGLGVRLWHSLMLDDAEHDLIAFALSGWFGSSPGVFTRSLSGAGGWQELGAGSDSVPRVRFCQSVVIDPLLHALVLYGGQATDGTGDLLADLWLLPLGPGGRWRRIVTSGPSPGARRSASFVFDAARSRLLYSGGDDLRQPIIDAWELRLDSTPAWRAIAMKGLVPRYQWLLMDPVRADAWCLFYAPGQTAPVCHVEVGDDTLTYESLSMTGTVPRYGPACAGFDAMRRRLLWLGGDDYGENVDLSMAWSTALSLSAIDWQPLGLTGVAPSPRRYMSTLYDPGNSHLVLVGGYQDNGSYFGDTWALDLSEQATAIAVSLVDARSGADGVRIRWSLGGAAVASCAVERSSDGLEWIAAGSAEAVGDDQYEFDADALAPNTRAAFRLLAPDGASTRASEAVWLEGPATGARFAISAVSNPAHGELAVRLSLPSSAPARVRLFDVGGRLVREQGVSGGEQVLALGDAPGPGLYFVVLEQAGRRSTARIVAAP